MVQDVRVATPHLWQGVRDPYLYTLRVEVLDRAGAVVDRVSQGFGIRQMAFDPDRGFSLNGRALPLHGVAMHQDFLGKGWAIADRDTDESLALVKEIGANTLRLAHYPHAQHTLRSGRRDGPGGVGRSAVRQRRPPVVYQRAGDTGVLGQPRAAASRADSPAVQPPVRRACGRSATRTR